MAKKNEKDFEICTKCLGSGDLPGPRLNHFSLVSPRKCWKCGGTGKIEKEVKNKKKLKIFLKILANIFKKKEFYSTIKISLIVIIDYYILKMLWESANQVFESPFPIPAKLFFATGVALVIAMFVSLGGFLIWKIGKNIMNNSKNEDEK